MQIDARMLSMNEIITLQGEDYGIITVFYCQTKNSVKDGENKARMDEDIEHSETYETKNVNVSYSINDHIENERAKIKARDTNDNCKYSGSKNQIKNLKDEHNENNKMRKIQ